MPSFQVFFFKLSTVEAGSKNINKKGERVILILVGSKTERDEEFLVLTSTTGMRTCTGASFLRTKSNTIATGNV